MKAVDVFTPNKMPTVTFIHDHLKANEDLLRDSLEKGGTLISISGPSKSGKTAFVNTVLGAGNVYQVTGAGIKNTDEIWLQVLHQIGTPIAQIEAAMSSASNTSSATGSVEGNAFFVKAKAEVSATGEHGTSSTKTTTKAITIFQLLIDETAATQTAIFIDDFHYIDSTLQKAIAEQIKDAISKGVWIICAFVPHRSEDVLRANNDLQGRIVAIDFAYWKPDVLVKIATKGFDALNIEVSDELRQFFAEESAGSPQLMQSLCLDACFASGIKERQTNRDVISDTKDLREMICTRTSATVDYSSTVEKLKLGPRTRGTARIHFTLTDNSVQDVYVILLRAIALSPPKLHFQYPDLVARISLVCQSSSPQGSSVTTACEHIAKIANATQPRNLIDWSSDGDILDIREPLLLFYLRWNGAF